MRIRYSILAVLCAGACAFGQQPAPKAPQPNAPSSEPEKTCNWQAARGSSGPWKSTSTCEPPRNNQNTPTLTPHADSAPQQKQSSQQANPFPEAQSQKAAEAANAAKRPSGSSSHVDMKRFDAPAGSEARISNGEGGYVHDPQLGAKDVRVGDFYLQTRDYKGAYDRFLEATRVAPENGQAVFGLAEAARGLRRTQEAVTNYTVYLQAFPDGKKAKDAQKALKELSSAKR
ncbi:MAG: hypothetical protein WBD10_09770 [Acidobacteriaceae bacterium]